jgi:hypothetical protein
VSDKQKDNQDQITLRLPRSLARTLQRRAKEQRVPKSQVVREALMSYLVASEAEPEDAWQRVAPFIGAVRLDAAAAEHDALTQQIRDHNWRE